LLIRLKSYTKSFQVNWSKIRLVLFDKNSKFRVS